ncbi:MAG: UPF0182 family protein [Chloroflexia bacterium]|nr:UPF0182 family protein [Chloroflexia bacterium]
MQFIQNLTGLGRSSAGPRPGSAPPRRSWRPSAATMRMLVTALIFIVLFIGLILTSTFWVNWWWYESAGYSSVLTTRYLAQGLAFMIGGVVAAAFFTLNWMLALRRSYGAGSAAPGSRPSRFLRIPLWILSLVVFFVAGLAASSQWVTWLLFSGGGDFNIVDPIFGRDAGFYVFALPVLSIVQDSALNVLFLTTIVTLIVYIIGFGVDGLDPRNPPLRMRTHVLGLIGGIVLLFGLSYLIANFELQYSTRGFTYGVGFTDANITRWINYALVIISIAAALFLILNSFVRRLRLLVAAAALWLIAVAIGIVLPPIVQQTVVEPSQLSREQTYITNNIALTRAAYGLQELELQDLSGQGTPPASELTPESESFDNIRLWDYRIIRASFQQLRGFVPYYSFHDVDVDRYEIDGNVRQVMLSARELNFDGLPDNAQTWPNQHFVYTHGYGAVVSPVSEATVSGLPIFAAGGIPPDDTGPLAINRPEIYFGELDQPWVAVNSAVQEINGIAGETPGTPYEGVAAGSIKVDNILRRAIMATYLGDRRVFLSSELTEDSRILIRRSISERAEAIAPFLTFDPDPYLVIADGRLVWVIDAYTTSDRFPGATPDGDINYIRHTVKVTIDAYSGTTTFYRTGEPDPIADAYGRIFGDLFTPIAEAPPAISFHFRYPELIFNAQSEIYSSYHVTDPVDFYNGEDRWEIAAEVVEDSDTGEGVISRMEAYYMTLPLPGQAESGFGLVRAFTPNQRQNMTAWMAGHTDMRGVTRLTVYRFPRQSTVYGPQQIESLISQDPFISAQTTLLGQSGTRVIRGNLLVIPIEETILYVQPLYLQATAGQGAPTELKYVIVATNEQVEMWPTLAEALGAIVGDNEQLERDSRVLPTTAPVDDPPDVSSSLARQALDSYERAQEALERGDWAAYGDEQATLERLLTEIVAEAGGVPVATPVP